MTGAECAAGYANRYYKLCVLQCWHVFSGQNMVRASTGSDRGRLRSFPWPAFPLCGPEGFAESMALRGVRKVFFLTFLSENFICER